MEYRIFGTDQRPPDDFNDDLAAFFRLDDQQREVIAGWFLSTRDYELFGPSLPPAVVASTLLPEQFRQAAGVIRRLLYNWQRFGLDLRDIERDLLLLGVNPEHLGILSAFLARLSLIRERVWLDGIEGSQHGTGLPTIDDVNIVWNARPLFGGPSCYYYKADGDDPYTQFCGLTYIAIVEIVTSDSYFARRENPPAKSNYREYKPFLRRDFLARCAYCERTEEYLGGEDAFEVEHFRPKSKFPDLIFAYHNLYYACRGCNGHKWETWPSEEQIARGQEFADPCVEDPYLHHLRELEDGDVEELTECGAYSNSHIRLDRSELRRWRRLRSEAR